MGGGNLDFSRRRVIPHPVMSDLNRDDKNNGTLYQIRAIMAGLRHVEYHVGKSYEREVQSFRPLAKSGRGHATAL
jgi:hypothetical protein